MSAADREAVHRVQFQAMTGDYRCSRCQCVRPSHWNFAAMECRPPAAEVATPLAADGEGTRLTDLLAAHRDDLKRQTTELWCGACQESFPPVGEDRRSSLEAHIAARATAPAEAGPVFNPDAPQGYDGKGGGYISAVPGQPDALAEKVAALADEWEAMPGVSESTADLIHDFAQDLRALLGSPHEAEGGEGS